jgi:hypothetical protein
MAAISIIMTKSKIKYCNYQIITLALYKAGGKLRYIDIEDIALEADKLAPGKFRWTKYKDMISDSIIRDALSDATRKRSGELVLGSAKEGWILTKEGINFCKKNRKIFETTYESQTRLTKRERGWKIKERARLLHESAFRKYTDNLQSLIDKSDIESFFRLNDYITGKIRQKKIQVIFNNFSEDQKLGNAVKYATTLIRKNDTND